MRVCIVYVVKEVASFQGARALSQLMGMECNRMCAQVLQTNRKKAACSLRRNY